MVYNPNYETGLHTYASAEGYGSVLLQKQGDGKFHPVAYYSKCPTASESKHQFRAGNSGDYLCTKAI